MMKSKKIELDVDFIGGQGPLTEEEERALSEYLKQKKINKNKAILKSAKSVKRSNVNAG